VLTTATARQHVAEARVRTARRLAGTPWRLNAEVSGAWLRDGPVAPPPAVRRPLDAALHRGALTLRGYDRVLRVAWTLADLDASPQLGTEHIGRALYLKKGIAL
jgi:magnesium chelatase family protein